MNSPRLERRRERLRSKPKPLTASTRFISTENSHLLAYHLPNVQLRIYADAGHGLLDQHLELFADHIRAFLDGG